MCVTATLAVVGSSLLKGYGEQQSAYAKAGEARQQGLAKLYEGYLDKEMRNMEADQAMVAAQKEADNIKRQALLMRSQMVVAQSGSGVVIGEGSAQAALDQLDALSSADALAAIYSGVNKATSLRANGRFAAQTGENQFQSAQRAAKSYEEAGTTAMLGSILQASGQSASLFSKAPKIDTKGTKGE